MALAPPLSPRRATHLLPLMDVADEARQAEQAQQAEDLGEAHDAQGAGRLVDLRVDAFLHDEEDVVHGDGGYEVHDSEEGEELTPYTIEELHQMVAEGEREFSEGKWQDSEDMFRELEEEFAQEELRYSEAV